MGKQGGAPSQRPADTQACHPQQYRLPLPRRLACSICAASSTSARRAASASSAASAAASARRAAPPSACALAASFFRSRVPAWAASSRARSSSSCLAWQEERVHG